MSNVEILAAELAAAEGHSWDDLSGEDQEYYEQRGQAVLDRMKAGRARGGDDELQARRVAVLAKAFSAGKPMAAALRESEPDLAASYVPNAVARAFEWDYAHDRALVGAGSWGRKGNEGLRVECRLTTPDGQVARWRFATLAEASEWVRSLDGPEGGWL